MNNPHQSFINRFAALLSSIFKRSPVESEGYSTRLLSSGRSAASSAIRHRPQSGLRFSFSAFFFALFFAFAATSFGQQSITTAGSATTENFNSIGSSSTANIPSAWKMGTDWSTGATATTQAAGTSGTGVVTSSSSGGFYNWASGVTGSSTDRAIGFLTSGSYSSPRSIIYAFTNNTGGTISSLVLSWDYEKYRTATGATDWTFFHGSSSTAGTAATGGDQSYSADASSAAVNPPTSTSKSVTLTGLSIANGATYYLRWTFTRSGNTNAQGLGIDNFSITLATAPTGVTTGAAGSITASGATISTSNVTADGGSAITERGVVYATTSNPTTSNTKVTASGTTGTFDSTLTGLAASTTYYVRAYATNGVGTTYGSDVSFTTSSASTPTLTAATLASALTATYPSASSGVSFTAQGTNLTENILVTAQSGYEVSTSSGSGYGPSVSVATGTTVWVRFAASRNAGNYNGATAAVLSGGGAASNANVTTSSSGNTISKGTPSISAAPTASNITFGQTLANSNLTGGTASVAGSFAFTTSSTAPNAGTASQGVTFTPTDTANYNTATTNVNVTVNKATPSLSITSAANAVIGGTVPLTSTSPAASGSVSASTGAVTYTTSNSSIASIASGVATGVAAGSVTITATQAADSNYNQATQTQTFTVYVGPTTLAAGDIVLVQINTDDPDTFAFVPLVDLNIGTVINFTDNAWTGSALGTTEGTLTWNATSPVFRGTVVTYNGTSFSTGSVSGSGFALSTSGDAIIAYQGTNGSPTFVYALASNIWITSGSTTANTSYLPTGLTNGTSARDFTSEVDNSYYNISSFSGNKSSIQASVGNSSNWTRSDSLPSAPTFSFTVKDDQTITFGSLSAVTYGDSSFALGATASSGLTVTYTSSNTAVATVAGSTVTIVGAGSTNITANQTGNATFNAATDVSQSLTVNPKALTGSFTANNKVYDGNTSASVATRAVSGKVGADDVNHTGGTATFDTASVGTVKTVTLAGASLTGTAAANYSLASISTTTANITTAALTITGISIANKTYDGNTTATITGTAAYSGLVLGQSLSVTGTGSATFGNSTVGSNKPVTVSGYTAPNGNYSITQPTGLTGNITAASVTVTAGNQTKAFGASDPTLTYTPSPALIAGNSFTGALSRAAGEGVGTYAISQGTLSAGSNYTISFVGANLTITQATPTVSVAPTASTITSGQALSSSVLSGGVASVAGSFAFTTPATVPSPGISSQGVTFTPTDSGNYTAQTTSVDVGVLCTAPVLTRGSNPTGTGFTVNWGAVTGAGNYTVIHSASKNMSDATSADTTSTSLTLTVPSGIRYVQVRANNAAGASANSTMQVNQLRSIAAGATAFLSVPGVVNGGNATIAEIFGSSNEAGLAANGTPSNSTNIIRLNADGDTLAGIIFRTGSWTRGDTVVNTEIIPAGKAFMLKNNSSEVDHILLVASAAEGPRSAVSISAPSGKHSLLTPARTKATPLTTLGFTDGGNNTATGIKRATLARDADVIIIQNNSGRFIPYHFDGTNWRNNRTIVDPSTISVPSGGAFYIRKASGSNFSEWTPPAED